MVYPEQNNHPEVRAMKAFNYQLVKTHWGLGN